MNEQRAVGDAGPYGGIDESAPVLGGAPMRAVEDAGPYGVYDRSHGGTTAGRRGRRPLRRDRREYAGTRRCADAVRRGRRPLRSKALPRGAWERQRG